MDIDLVDIALPRPADPLLAVRAPLFLVGIGRACAAVGNGHDDITLDHKVGAGNGDRIGVFRTTYDRVQAHAGGGRDRRRDRPWITAIGGVRYVGGDRLPRR